jgi:hypothetical protein
MHCPAKTEIPTSTEHTVGKTTAKMMQSRSCFETVCASLGHAMTTSPFPHVSETDDREQSERHHGEAPVAN